MDHRLDALGHWTLAHFNQPVSLYNGVAAEALETVSGDASFRRYFRYRLNGESYIVMDAPPEKEDSTSFVAIAQSWHQQGVCVPEIVKADLEQGFLLLKDFGDDLLLASLNADVPDVAQGNRYYRKAIDSLIRIQGLDAPEDYHVPPYDAALLQREMALFPDWLLRKKLALELSEEERHLLSETFTLLEQRALSQKQVMVHRDYHSRNLMILPNDEIGIIDFQDAVIGPLTYDLVSLLRDCYIVWPAEEVDRWCRDYFNKARLNQSLLGELEYESFKKDFDWMGLQRHLKAAGIFARLSMRDGKHGYLNDIPRTVEYLVSVSQGYEELEAFNRFLRSRVVPKLTQLQRGQARTCEVVDS